MGQVYYEFFRLGANYKKLWTVRDANGYPAPKNADGKRCMPFWSTLTRVEKVIKKCPAYHGFEPAEVPLEKFLSYWIPELEKDGILIGIEWSGPKAKGIDISPEQARKNFVEDMNLNLNPVLPSQRRSAKKWWWPF